MGVLESRKVSDTLACQQPNQNSSLSCQGSWDSRGRAQLCHPRPRHPALPKTREPVVMLLPAPNLLLSHPPTQEDLAPWHRLPLAILSRVFIFIDLVLMALEIMAHASLCSVCASQAQQVSLPQASSSHWVHAHPSPTSPLLTS